MATHDPFLFTAAGLLVAIGLAHSVLGERYILTRLFRGSTLPPLFGGEAFTRRTLRFAWHLTTVAWWGIAGVLLALTDALDVTDTHGPNGTRGLVLTILAFTFLITGATALIASRGRHLSWVVFLAIGFLCGFAAGV